MEELITSASAKAKTLTPRDPWRIFIERVEKVKQEGGGGGQPIFKAKFKIKMFKFPPQSVSCLFISFLGKPTFKHQHLCHREKRSVILASPKDY